MAVISTHLFNISFSHQDLMKVLVKIDALSESIFPQEAKKIASNVKGVSIIDEENPYNEIVDDLHHLCDILDIEKPMAKSENTETSLKDMQLLVKDIYAELNQIQDVKEKLVMEREDNLEVMRVIKDMRDTNVDIDDIKECRYLIYRFGKLPVEQIEKIQYYQDYPFIYRKIRKEGNYVWIMYAGLTKNIGEIDNIFYALSFEEIELPDFVHGTLEDAYQELEEESKAMLVYIKQMNDRILNIKNKYQEKLTETFKAANTLKQLFDNAKCVVDFSHKESIFAFSSLEAKELEKQLQGISSISLLELPSNMYVSRGIQGPVILHNHPIFQPFERFNGRDMGIRFDGTPVIASIMLIISAILLGDIGVGILIFVLGLLLNTKQEQSVGRILSRLGIAITIGGLFTGMIGYHWTLYTSNFSLPLTWSMDVLVWIMVMIGSVVVVKGIQKITKNDR